MLNNCKKYILLFIFLFISIYLFPQSDLIDVFNDYILGGESWNNTCNRNNVYLSGFYEPCNNNEYVISFEDNFNGNTLDETKWEIQNAVNRDFEFNLARQWFKPENIEVSDGTLKLWARLERKVHTYWDPTEQPDNTAINYFNFGGAEIWSKKKFLHGKYEIKCRMPEGDGLWPAFWMYESEKNGEIDVFDNLPSHTSVDDYIKAGKNVGIDGVSGDVVVKSGQNVRFTAGNKIELLPGFVAEEGSTFVAEIKDCDNADFDDNITIEDFPDSFSPDNDGDNDHLIVEVNGATHYNIIVRGKWDINTYYEATNIPVYSNHIDVWSGNCNYTGNCWFYHKCNRKRKVHLHFYNCKNDKYTSKTVEVNCDSKGNTKSDTVQLNTKNKHSKDLSEVVFEIFPNPNKGIFNVKRTGAYSGIYSLRISNDLGKLIFQKSNIYDNSFEIDISNRPPGIYYLNIIEGENIHQENIILL